MASAIEFAPVRHKLLPEGGGSRQGQQAKIVAEVREGVRRRYEGEVRVEGSRQKE